MFELFVVGSVWFWALIAVEIILLFIFTEYDNGIGATVSLIAFGALLQWCGNVNILGYLAKNWYMLIPVGLAYLALGACWGTWRWRKFCCDRLRDHDELFQDFLQKKNLPHDTKVLPVNFRRDWKDCIERTRDYQTNQTLADTPRVRQHKAKVTRWMSLWVFSLSLFMFKDMVREAFRAMYAKLANFLQKIADDLYSKANVKENLEIPPDEQSQANAHQGR